MSAAPSEPLDPALFGEPPARDDRFTVVDRWADCVNLPDDHAEKPIEFFHRQMNEELNVLENAARNIAEFPDADWELRMWLARQCADEARHALVYRRILDCRGGWVGRYPVMNFQYRILGTIDTLIGRLAVQNRTFEADGLDAAVFAAQEAAASGDAELAELFDAQQADEVVHIRFANDWIRQRVAAVPRDTLAMARALSRGATAFRQVFGGGGTEVTKYGVAQDARLLAGFDADEVRVATDLAEARRARARAATRGD
jgi:uncharacterized ferritin-like protein (DUF455 family)